MSAAAATETDSEPTRCVSEKYIFTFYIVLYNCASFSVSFLFGGYELG